MGKRMCDKFYPGNLTNVCRKSGVDFYFLSLNKVLRERFLLKEGKIYTESHFVESFFAFVFS